MRTIYIDILLSVNLAVNYLLLSAAAYYLHEDAKIKRLLLGSAVGAFGSLSILLPVLPFFLNALLKMFIGAACVLCAFGRCRARLFLKRCAVFLTATFFFAGTMAAVWLLFTPDKLVIKNSVVYLDISPLVLILLSVVCYGIFRIIVTIGGSAQTNESLCSLTLRRGGSFVTVTARIDTGNTLREPFSQCPVIVIGRRTAEAITPEEITEYETVRTLRYRTEIAGVRFVPFSSVGGSGILPCFKADEVYTDGTKCTKRVYIALCSDDYITGDCAALVPAEII